MDDAESNAKWLELASIANKTRVSRVFAYCHNSGISPILIKGWSVERFYGNGHYRPSTDIDLMFPLVSEGFDKPIIDIGESIAVDVHNGPRHLDLLSFEDLCENSYTVDLNDVPIRVLSDEDNLRITSVHWLTDGGVNKERLWDIFYLLKNRKADFDWVRCLESNGPIRKTWVLAAIASARDHLELDVSGLPDEAQQFELPEWYRRTLEKEWKRGIYPRHRLITVLMRPKLLLEQIKRKFPPNRIAATVDSETPIDDTSRIPSQLKSLAKKLASFARGIRARIT